MFLKAPFLHPHSFLYILLPSARSYKSTPFYNISLLIISLSVGASYLDLQPSLTKISKCITYLNFWFTNNHFMLNLTKSEVMFVGALILLAQYNLPTEVTLDGLNLPISSKLKILGVTLDLSLNFTLFASQIIQASNFHLYAIKQLSNFLLFNTAVALTISSVLSKLEYCNSFLCGLPNCLISKLQSFQNRAAKTVLQIDYYSLSCSCLNRLHWLLVALRAQFKLLWLTANILYFNQPTHLYKLYFIRQTHESLSSSNSGLWLHQPVSPNSSYHIASHLWNFLPLNLLFFQTFLQALKNSYLLPHFPIFFQAPLQQT